MDQVGFRNELRNELRNDALRTSRAMADAHALYHDPHTGWNKCELDPCWIVGVLLGSVALVLMEGEPEPAA